jgi:DNA uptake protein ComE-like DNA-binding protein
MSTPERSTSDRFALSGTEAVAVALLLVLAGVFLALRGWSGSPDSRQTVPSPVPYLIPVNEASPELLETLPGVGPVAAARMIEYRTTAGPITTVEELAIATGLSVEKAKQLLPLVSFETSRRHPAEDR